MKNKILHIITLSSLSSATILAQNVGIGTLTPTEKLHVEGTLRVTSLGGVGNALVLTDNNGVVTPTALSGNATDVFTGAGTWVPISGLTDGWKLLGNSGTNPATNFVGTIDAQDFVFRTSNAERMRITSVGNVGIGTALPAGRLQVSNADGSRMIYGTTGNLSVYDAEAFVGEVRLGSAWSRPGVYSSQQLELFSDATGIIFGDSNIEYMRMTDAGRLGIGTPTPAATAKLQVVGGAIMPQIGNTTSTGIHFPSNAYGGGGDDAYIRYYSEAGENTKLVIANQNDADDDIDFQTGGRSRLNIDGDGSIRIDEGVLFDCPDCGATNTIDGTANWGDLVIQGRVLSTNANMHLSPPGGSRVIINSTYRAGGGGTGTTGLDIEDGGIRMRKNYYYFQRYLYCNCYGAGSGAWDIGNYDFCAVAQVGFKNNQSVSDEDDDVQCAVYPRDHGGYGETTNYNTSYTYQYNQRPFWRMYAEAFQDTNGVTCAASCINFD